MMPLGARIVFGLLLIVTPWPVAKGMNDACEGFCGEAWIVAAICAVTGFVLLAPVLASLFSLREEHRYDGDESGPRDSA